MEIEDEELHCADCHWPGAMGMCILFVFNSHAFLANCFPYSYTIMVMFPVLKRVGYG
jgi:hypothetical protein